MPCTPLKYVIRLVWWLMSSKLVLYTIRYWNDEPFVLHRCVREVSRTCLPLFVKKYFRDIPNFPPALKIAERGERIANAFQRRGLLLLDHIVIIYRTSRARSGCAFTRNLLRIYPDPDTYVSRSRPGPRPRPRVPCSCHILERVTNLLKIRREMATCSKTNKQPNTQTIALNIWI